MKKHTNKISLSHATIIYTKAHTRTHTHTHLIANALKNNPSEYVNKWKTNFHHVDICTIAYVYRRYGTTCIWTISFNWSQLEFVFHANVWIFNEVHGCKSKPLYPLTRHIVNHSKLLSANDFTRLTTRTSLLKIQRNIHLQRFAGNRVKNSKRKREWTAQKKVELEGTMYPEHIKLDGMWMTVYYVISFAMWQTYKYRWECVNWNEAHSATMCNTRKSGWM